MKCKVVFVDTFLGLISFHPI